MLTFSWPRYCFPFCWRGGYRLMSCRFTGTVVNALSQSHKSSGKSKLLQFLCLGYAVNFQSYITLLYNIVTLLITPTINLVKICLDYFCGYHVNTVDHIDVFLKSVIPNNIYSNRFGWTVNNWFHNFLHCIK